MNLEKVIKDMKNCYQIPGRQTVWEHGESVSQNLLRLYDFCEKGIPLPSHWVVPEWLHQRKDELFPFLYQRDTLERYAVFHDCGKPYCETKDDAC